MTNNVEPSNGDAAATIKVQPSKEKNVSHMHFYQNDLLTTKVSAQRSFQLLRMQDVALAQLEQKQAPKMLLTDSSKSVMGMPPNSMTYSPYGYLHAIHSNALLAYNGYEYDPITQGYLLGNGYRLFNSCLMRFCCQDSMSPFGRGGLNAYAYCIGDPVNNTDANGHFRIPFLKRSPISKLSHYTTKKQLLADKEIKIKNKISHYETKIQELTGERNQWRTAALDNNYPDRRGNRPSEQVATLNHDIGRNEAKLNKQDNKLTKLEAYIERTHEKFLNTQQLVASQTPATNNELPGYATLTQQQTQVRASP